MCGTHLKKESLLKYKNFMATIIIKGNRLPIEIDNARAREIKYRWLGINGSPKADPEDMVDIGEWAGKYNRILEIRMNKEEPQRKDVAQERIDEQKEETEVWLKLTPEQKGCRMARFHFLYACRTGKYNELPHKKISYLAQKIQNDYYRKYPTARFVPSEVYGELLPPRVGEKLTDKMRI